MTLPEFNLRYYTESRPSQERRHRGRQTARRMNDPRTRVLSSARVAPSLPAATPAARPAAVVKAAAVAVEEEVEMTSASCAAAAGPVCGGPAAAAVAGAGGAD